MSQQKFASNVIEKCLSFGTPAERQALVNEMLGTTDENEPLQVSQYAFDMLEYLQKCVDIFSFTRGHVEVLFSFVSGHVTWD